jgi:hypothetical protein
VVAVDPGVEVDIDRRTAAAMRQYPHQRGRWVAVQPFAVAEPEAGQPAQRYPGERTGQIAFGEPTPPWSVAIEDVRTVVGHVRRRRRASAAAERTVSLQQPDLRTRLGAGDRGDQPGEPAADNGDPLHDRMTT